VRGRGADALYEGVVQVGRADAGARGVLGIGVRR
jgi:hypothetical protein